jgi:hypothetical protein
MEVANIMVSASTLGHLLLQKKVEPFSGTAEKRFDFKTSRLPVASVMHRIKERCRTK